MAKVPDEAQKRAEATFKKKELQAREGAKAMQEYEAAGQAMRDKTARLRELRLAKEAADLTSAKATAAAKIKPAKKAKVAVRAKTGTR